MLLHLLQTLAAHPSLAEGLAPPGLLHATEEEQLEAFRVVKRRRDWLLGRWTAKHLVQRYLFATTATLHPLPGILIIAASDGAPYAALDLEPPAGPNQYPPMSNSRSFGSAQDKPFGSAQDMPPIPPLPLSLSISHSGDRAFCALTDEPGERIGSDIEQIEPREPGFIEQFFTPTEIAAVRSSPSHQRDMLITAIWSAKEAVLKALRVGLRADTRHAKIKGVPAGRGHGGGSLFVADWAPFQVELQAPHLSLSQGSSLIGWWRAEDAYVQTLALLSPVGSIPDHHPSSDPGFLP